MTDVVQEAEPRLADDTTEYRPLLGGCQLAHGGGWGTLGGMAYDKTDSRPVLLTCNHVLTTPASRNLPFPANDPDSIFQPRGAVLPAGNVKRVVPWVTPPLGMTAGRLQAWVDAGIASVDRDVDLAFQIVEVGREPSVIGEATVGMDVVKRGARTGLTQGTVETIDMTVSISAEGATIGGIGSGFSVRSQKDSAFALQGDSGSLILDADHTAGRGLLFSSDLLPGGLAYGCQLTAVYEALQLETPVPGVLHALTNRAVWRRVHATHGNFRLPPSSRFPSEYGKFIENIDTFWSRYLFPDSKQAVGPIGRSFQSLAQELPANVYEDEDFAGMLEQAFGEWLVSPTVFDMLEYRFPAEFPKQVERAFGRLRELHSSASVPRSIHELVTSIGGMRVRDLLEHAAAHVV